MAEITELTPEQQLKLDVYNLVMNKNSAAEEALAFIGNDKLKLELFKIHFQAEAATADPTTRTIEAVRKAKEAIDLFTIGA